MQHEEEVKSEQLSATHLLAERWITAFNSRDLSTIVQLYADDAELYDSGMNRPRHGQKEIESWFRLRFGSMQANVYAPETYHPIDEEHITVDWIFYGQSPALLGLRQLARPFQVNGTSAFTFRNNRIMKQHGTYDHAFVLRQILPWARWLPQSLLQAAYHLYLFRHHQL